MMFMRRFEWGLSLLVGGDVVVGRVLSLLVGGDVVVGRVLVEVEGLRF